MIKSSRNVDPEHIREVRDFMKKLFDFVKKIESEKMELVDKYVQKENVNCVEKRKTIKGTNRFDFGANLEKFEKEFENLANQEIDVIPAKIEFSKIASIDFNIDMFDAIEPFLKFD
jgi:hypothetical protein